MGREARMVTKNWEHPKDQWSNNFVPLKDGYEKDLAQFEKDIEEKGLAEALDWWGGGPVSDDYMLVGCDDAERTHIMMYENTSEGTPISPGFETPEELAQWLTDNNASAFARNTATYEQWLRVCKGGYAPSAVYTPETGLVSGVAALFDHP